MDASCSIHGRGYPDMARRGIGQRYPVPGSVQALPQRFRLVRHVPHVDLPVWQVRLPVRARGPRCRATPSDGESAGANDLAESRQRGQEGAVSSTVGDTSQAGIPEEKKGLLFRILENSALAGRSNDHYLAKRQNKHWWKHAFPKVPADSLATIDAELKEPVTIWQKLLPLGLIFFCASFNLTILQSLKDAIMVTSAGAETLPFLASLGVLPASIAFFMFYGRCVQRLNPDNVFYVAILPLVLFYAFFAAVLYPAAGVLHPHGFYDALAPMLPTGLHGLLKMIENWTYSMFFCVAELWGSVVISVLFWSLANNMCSVSDAKTIYPLMGIAANIALVVAGNYVKWISKTVTQGVMGSSLQILVASVVGMTALMMATKAFVDRTIPKPPSSERKGDKKKKKKGSLGESFKVLKNSPMISNLALLVVGYGLTHRLFEFCWKGQLRLLYPSAAAYQSVLADVAIWTGYTTIALMLTGRFVFQFLGWRVAALATPTVMLVAGAAFFGLSIFASAGGSTLAAGTMNLASLGALAGAITQVFARSSKFSLFDPAKEMVYIEMRNPEEKSSGKAAVDLLGSQIGKTGASWATQALLIVLGSIRAAMPLVSVVYVAVISAWIVAVNRLALKLKELDNEDQAEENIPQIISQITKAEVQGTSVNGKFVPVSLDAVPVCPSWVGLK
eukprot:jgi/Botrbrau1/15029/Bobra.320_2s0006.3